MKEGLNHGSLLDSLPSSLGDLFDGTLEFLDLDQGGIGQRFEEGEGLINVGGGGVEFFNLGFIIGMLLFSDQSVLSDSLSVETDVLLDGVDSLLDLLSSGDEKVVDNVVHSSNVLFSVLDILGQLDDEGVVLVGSDLVIELELFKFLVQVLDQFFDGSDELLDGTLDS